MSDRGDVWLAAGGLVIVENEVLVVQKTYGKTKGLWTMPGGFAQHGETIDETVAREVLEETGIQARPIGVLAIRTGVLRTEVQDTFIAFLCQYEGGTLQPDPREIGRAAFAPIADIATSPDTTEFLANLLADLHQRTHIQHTGLPKRDFPQARDYGYHRYKVFF